MDLPGLAYGVDTCNVRRCSASSPFHDCVAHLCVIIQVVCSGVGLEGRRSGAARERMRILVSAAAEGRGEDHFGTRDDDWDVYRVQPCTSRICQTVCTTPPC